MTIPQHLSVLRIDASARHTDSITRALGDTLISALRAQHPTLNLVQRDLAATPPALLSADWVAANFTDPQQRTAPQRAALTASDTLVAELQAADVVVIGVPIYNFSIPAALKAWIDLVARARVTFRYSDSGPVGLLQGKRAYIVMASGGVAIGSDADFASGYLRHVLGFLGITDVEIIAADQAMLRSDALALAQQRIDAALQAAAA